MKFLCDRCKTRYSIADERVRGKVLKIRCKSCSHVITVREGMTDDEADAPAAAAAAPSTAAPAAAVTGGGTFAGVAPAGRGTASGSASTGPASAASTGSRAGNGSALASAFAQVMQPQRADTEPPPPALEEEWYVSLDGHQEGPYSLAEAQAWIAGKKHDDDLYCWSEGFDDWLPVDKVSHFRALRKVTPPARGKPPAPGRAAAGSAGSAAAARAPASPTDTPAQPLFAATLASLEAEIDAVDAGRGKPAAKINGKGAAGGVGPTAAGITPTAAGSAALTSLSKSSSAPSKPSAADAKARPAASLFDLEGDGSRPDRELPELEPDDDEDDDDGQDDDLEIGEVSRVVRLPDLMAAHHKQIAARSATSRTGQTQAIRTPAAAIARGTGGVASLTAVASAPDGSAVAADGSALPPLSDAALADLQPSVVSAPAQKHHVVLLAMVALGVLLIGGVISFVVLTQSGDEGSVSTGDITRFDSLGRRIDDPQKKAKAQAQAQAEAAKASGKGGTTIKKPFGTNTGSSQVGTGASPGGKTEIVIGPDGKPLEPLTVDEMLAVSSKMSSGTRRCYERALKEDPFLKVSKITVSIVVEDSGVVSSVTLDAFTTQTLGKCLTAAIRRWPFRRSPKRESFVFPLVFEQR